MIREDNAMNENESIELNKEQLDCVTGGKAESTGIEEKIYQIVADHLDLKPSSFNGDSSLIGDLGADTFDMLDIVARIEEAFCIRIPEGIMYRFQTVEDLIQYVIMNT